MARKINRSGAGMVQGSAEVPVTSPPTNEVTTAKSEKSGAVTTLPEAHQPLPSMGLGERPLYEQVFGQSLEKILEEAKLPKPPSKGLQAAIERTKDKFAEALSKLPPWEAERKGERFISGDTGLRLALDHVVISNDQR